MTDERQERANVVGMKAIDRALGLGLDQMSREEYQRRQVGHIPPESTQDTHAILQQILNTEVTLRREVNSLQEQLTTERDVREQLERILRNIAELVLDASKR